jgi:hypothetical protein
LISFLWGATVVDITPATASLRANKKPPLLMQTRERVGDLSCAQPTRLRTRRMVPAMCTP